MCTSLFQFVCVFKLYVDEFMPILRSFQMYFCTPFYLFAHFRFNEAFLPNFLSFFVCSQKAVKLGHIQKKLLMVKNTKSHLNHFQLVLILRSCKYSSDSELILHTGFKRMRTGDKKDCYNWEEDAIFALGHGLT